MESQHSYASTTSPFPMSSISGGSLKKPRKGSTNVDRPQKRIPLACSTCRDRKTKCLGGNPCQQCIRSNKQCIYKQRRRCSMSEEHYNNIISRLRAYEGATETLTYLPEDQTSPSSIDVEDEETDGMNSNTLLEGITRLTVSPSGRQPFVGAAASITVGLRLVETLNTGEQTVDTEFDRWRAPWPSRRNSTSPLPPLPPYDFAKRLYAAQFAYIGTIFSFLTPQKFEERLQQVYVYSNDLVDQESCLQYCQLLMIFAFGEMYSVNQWVGYDGPPGFQHFTQAMKFLPDIHEEGSILFVETLSLVGYFMQNLNRRDAAFLYIGLAVRMAISLGLHEEVSDPTLDDVEREHRRRLWWSVYSMDRILCVKSGNPFSIADEDIGVSLPSRLPGESEMSSAAVLLYYTQLSQILGKIMITIYRKTSRTKSHLVTSVQTIMNDLTRWLRDLPAALRSDFTSLDRDISRESVSIFLHYYQTARPLLFHIVQKRLKNRAEMGKETDWRVGLSATTVSMIDRCIGAARDCTKMMASASRQNLWATFGFMDGEHAFSAALVLVMVNIAFATNPRDSAAMDKAMSVLQSMGEKGNGQIRSRYQLLKNLQSMIRLEETPEHHSTQTPQSIVDTNSLDIPTTTKSPNPHPTYDIAAQNNSAYQGMERSGDNPGGNISDVVDWENLDDSAGLIPFEAYEDFMDMDRDWTQWTTEATRNPEFPDSE